MQGREVRAAAGRGYTVEAMKRQVLLGIPEEDTFFNFTRPEKSHGPIDHYPILLEVRNDDNLAIVRFILTFACTKRIRIWQERLL